MKEENLTSASYSSELHPVALAGKAVLISNSLIVPNVYNLG